MRSLLSLAGVQYAQSRTTHFRTGCQFYRTTNSFEFCVFGFARFGTTSTGTLCCDWTKPESCSQHSLLQLSSATRRNGRPLSALLPTPVRVPHRVVWTPTPPACSSCASWCAANDCCRALPTIAHGSYYRGSLLTNGCVVPSPAVIAVGPR